MTPLFLILGGLGLFMFAKGKAATTTARTTARRGLPTAQSTGTQTTPDAWLPSFTGFTQAQMRSVGDNVSGAFSALSGLSNNFGRNDGGTNPGVSVGGSQRGGTQSSGSGAGLPVGTTSIQSGQSSPATQSTTAPLNGFTDDNYDPAADDSSAYDDSASYDDSADGSFDDSSDDSF
jgi:hypothetical protein